jgi:molecular chaperone DnaJ
LNPGDKTAEQKMRQINAAYEQIKTQKTGGASYERPDGSYGPQRHNQPGGGYTYRGDDPFGGFDFGGFGDIFGDIFENAWEQQQQGSGQPGIPMMRQIRLYIQIRQYQNALYMLSQISERDAEWYYLSAIANAGVGNRVTALNHAKDAVRMEPGNLEYQQLLDQFQQGSFTYRQAGQSQGFDMQSMGRSILQIMVAQAVCFFCCRPC